MASAWIVAVLMRNINAIAVAACALAVPCSQGCRTDESVPCNFDVGPWGPASLGDPCNAPPEIVVNALDSMCKSYRCFDNFWNDPDGSSCSGYILGQAAGDATYCLPMCL